MIVSNAAEAVEQMEFAYSAAENANGMTTLDNHLAASHPKTTPIVRLGKEMKTYVHKNLCVNAYCSFADGYQNNKNPDVLPRTEG